MLEHGNIISKALPPGKAEVESEWGPLVCGGGARKDVESVTSNRNWY